MEEASPQAAAASPTSDERTMAVLAHALQLVGGWLAPLIILIVKRDSKFVSFHALQALLLQILQLILWMIFIAGFMAILFATFLAHPQASNGPPTALFLLFPFLWLGAMGMWVFLLVIAIVYGIKAGHGEWAEYPLLGRLARHFLKLGPGGVSLTTS
jgi:uncharacterized Tic20 family protein